MVSVLRIKNANTLMRAPTRFVQKYTLRLAQLELGGVEREVRSGGNP